VRNAPAALAESARGIAGRYFPADGSDAHLSLRRPAAIGTFSALSEHLLTRQIFLVPVSELPKNPTPELIGKSGEFASRWPPTVRLWGPLLEDPLLEKGSYPGPLTRPAQDPTA
jgi:hypothetical protein